jgi:hypothetical protein
VLFVFLDLKTSLLFLSAFFHLFIGMQGIPFLFHDASKSALCCSRQAGPLLANPNTGFILVFHFFLIRIFLFFFLINFLLFVPFYGIKTYCVERKDGFLNSAPFFRARVWRKHVMIDLQDIIMWLIVFLFFWTMSVKADGWRKYYCYNVPYECKMRRWTKTMKMTTNQMERKQ